MTEDEKKMKETTKAGLYFELFVFAAMAFVFLLCICGYIVSKFIFILLFILAAFHVIITLIMLQALNIDLEVNK